MAQQLRAILEDWGLSPRTDKTAHNYLELQFQGIYLMMASTCTRHVHGAQTLTQGKHRCIDNKKITIKY